MSSLPGSIQAALRPVGQDKSAVVHDANEPEEAAPGKSLKYPRLTWQIENEEGLNTDAGDPKDVLINTEAISTKGMKEARALDEAAQGALHNRALQVDGWHTYRPLQWERSFSTTEPIEGGGFHYRQKSIYRLSLDRSPAPQGG